MQDGSAVIDIYDRDGNILGQKVRGEVNKDEDIVKTVVILVLNEGKELFAVIPKETFWKGKLGSSAAGMVQFGETPQEAAIRTLQRELNFQEELSFCGEQFYDFNGIQRFMSIFYCITDQKTSINHEDAESGQWVALDSLQKKDCMPTLWAAIDAVKKCMRD